MPINKRNTKDINILKLYKDTSKINKYKKLLKKNILLMSSDKIIFSCLSN
jgi:hypothetical protein